MDSWAKCSHPNFLLSSLKESRTARLVMYIFLCVTVLVSLYVVFYRTSADGPLPPGPKPLPIVGNVRDMPAPGSAEWLHWLKNK